MIHAIGRLPRHAGVLCFASFVVFVIMTVVELFYFRELSGGLMSLDIRCFGFTPDQGMAWLTALGRRGSEIIIVWHYLTFDLVFPALLTLTLMSLVLVTGRRLPHFAKMSVKAQVLTTLALVLPYTLADYGENIAVVRLLSNFVYANPDSLRLTSALIVTKFAFGAIPMMVIAAFFLAGRLRRHNERHG